MSTHIGPYRLDGLLGQGGMGEVHRAWDTRRGRWVALKLLDARIAADAGYRQRFRREAEVAARLSEPHVVPVHDFGEIDGRLFLDMRLVEGRDLAAVLRDGPVGTARSLALLTQVASALDAAHAAGLVHRDVKPSNVLVAPGDFAYVADFGLVHDRGDASTAGTDGILGTLQYMAPERLRGDPVDARADVYALACVLVECLTGARAFPCTEAAELVTAHLYGDPPRVTERDPALPARLDDVVARGLAKDPAERYPSAGALIAEASAAVATDPSPPDHRAPGRTSTPPRGADDPPPATRVGPPDPPRTTRRLRSVGVVVAMVAAVLLVVIVTVAVRRYVGDGTAVGLSPVAVVFARDGTQALVVNAGQRTVAVVDAGTRAVVRRVPLDGRAVGAAAPAGADRVLVTTIAGRLPAALLVLDRRTGGGLATVPLPERPTAPPAVDRAGTLAIVPGDTGVMVVDLERGVVTGTVPGRAAAVALSPDGRRAFLTGSGRAVVDVVDPERRTVLTSLPVDGPVGSLALDAGGDTLVVIGDTAAAGLTLVDAGAGAADATVALPGVPTGSAQAPDGRIVVAVDTPRPSLVVVDPRSRRVSTLGLLDEFTGRVALAVTPDGTQVWVANTDLGTLTVVSTRVRR